LLSSLLSPSLQYFSSNNGSASQSVIANMNVDRPARSIRLPWHRTGVEKDRNDTESILSRRVPLVGFMSIDVKNHFIAMMSEFVGTFMFLLFAFGGTNVVTTAPKTDTPLNADPSKLMYIAVCFGMSLAVNAVCSTACTLGLGGKSAMLTLSSLR
jgi:hypothetical protein